MAPTLFDAAVVILKQLVVTISLRINLIFGLIFGLMLASPNPAQAEANNVAAPSVIEQRSDYLEAISAIKSRQKNKYRRLRANLTHYPLYPYLEYTDKIYSLIRQNNDSIQGFIDQWADTPLADQLRQNWLYYLAKHHRWNEFLAMYDQTSTTSINACFYGYALYKADRLPEAYSQAQTLWLVSRSQPEECDPLFKVWRDADLLTDDMAWQRLQLAMADNKITLARYLLRFIGRADKSLARSYIDVHRRPELIRQTRRFSTDNRRQRQIILHGIKRLARRDAIAALATMQDYQASHEFDTAEIESTLTSIGIRLSRAGDPDAQLDSLPVTLTDQTQLLEARIRLALQQLDWGQALVLINRLEPASQQTTRWQYWRARILAGSSDSRDRASANQIYTQISSQRDFYSFLAADIVGSPYDYEDQPTPISDEEVSNLQAMPGMRRAEELFALNELSSARREWRFTTREFSPREQQIAARVTQGWGQYHQAIRAMIDAKAWDDLAIRFPLAYHDSFKLNTQAQNISLPWGIAIARQESAFMPDAQSGAGAMGLMQLMPATAKQTAQRHGVKYTSRQQLIDPETNIQLGTAYLSSMLQLFNNNRILASAAYNAGPTRVRGWLNPELPLDIWIETIPFKETRNYVQNVLMFTSIYARRLNQTLPMIDPSEWRDFYQPEVSTPASGSTPGKS